MDGTEGLSGENAPIESPSLESILGLEAGQSAEEPAGSEAETTTTPTTETDTTPTATGTTEAEPTPATEDSFTTIAVDDLPPELQPYAEQVYKSMQGDYTRSKQALAQQTEAFQAQQELIDAAGGVEAVQNALGLYEALYEKGDAETITGLFEQITQWAQANNVELPGLGPAAVETPTVDENEWGIPADHPLSQALAQMKGELDGFKNERQLAQQRAQQQQQEAEQAAQMEAFSQMENSVKEKYPDLDEDTVRGIVAVGFMQGDLEKGIGVAETLMQAGIKQAIKAKESIPLGVTPAAPSAGAATTAGATAREVPKTDEEIKALTLALFQAGE